MKKSAKQIGGSIHRILNNTLHRKLTVKEYSRLIPLIARFAETNRREECEKITAMLTVTAAVLKSMGYKEYAESLAQIAEELAKS